MSKTSSESCEVLETRELRDHELALVTGGVCDVGYLKDASAAFGRGDFVGGFQALADFKYSCQS